MTRKLQISIFLLILLLAGAGWFYSSGTSPSAVTALAGTGGNDIRLTGVVMYGTIEAEPSGLTRFVITDCQNDLPVEYTGTLPDTFREGLNVILTGTLDGDGIFRAQKLRPRRGENCDPSATAAPPAPQQAE